MMLRIVELFAGIGAQAAALDRIGADWQSVGMVEIDPYCVAVYNALNGTNYEPQDITKVKDLPDCDLLTYSFPCTDVSTAGRQAGLKEGSGTRSSLLWEVHRLLLSYRARGGLPPKYLLMENVKNLVGKRFKPDFDRWLEMLKELGYTTYWKVLNATDYGVPQNRERVFAISILNDDEGYEFPTPVPLQKKLKDVLERNVDEKYYIGVNAVNSRLESSFCHRNRSIIGGGGQQNADSPGIQRTDVCRTIRAGGRGSTDDKHTWDLIVEEDEEWKTHANRSDDLPAESGTTCTT